MTGIFLSSVRIIKTISQSFEISFTESWQTAVAGLLRRGFFVLVVRVRGLVFLLVNAAFTTILAHSQPKATTFVILT